jgi:Phytanoyl-CoA dioxygenase (PhyH)
MERAWHANCRIVFRTQPCAIIRGPGRIPGQLVIGSLTVSFIRRLFSRVTGNASGQSRPISFADLSETPDPDTLPPLDRADLDSSTLTPDQAAWRRDGVVILRKFLPDSLTDPYIARRRTLDKPGGWASPVPYLQVPELRSLALYPPLMTMLEHLIGEPMLLHLALTGWISTERNWHQDDYLNPPFVNSWYAAVWIALDHIDPASGPFEYVPGSHRWPVMRGEKVRGFLTEEELSRKENGINHWPTYSERFVAPAIEAEIAHSAIPPRTFLGEKGDVLIWHGRLMHRGSLPQLPGRERRSLIVHYSGVDHRPDMVERDRDENGQEYAVFDIPLH